MMTMPITLMLILNIEIMKSVMSITIHFVVNVRGELCLIMDADSIENTKLYHKVTLTLVMLLVIPWWVD